MTQLIIDHSIDPRLKNLSYSSLLTLHSCPRKFQLSRCNESLEREGSVTFAFGHAVGEGIQSLVLGLSREETIWRMFLAWDFDLLAEESKDNKSFWYAIHSLDKFADIAKSLLKDYDIAYIANKDGELVPATELSFKIDLMDGFNYIGYVDLVLKHRITSQLMVLELKTTKFNNVSEASYKNSAQAIGYSIVLDSIVNDTVLSDYKVMYLVYKSGVKEFEPLIFAKSFTQRAMWIQQIIMDVELITKYAEANIFPSYGESCFNYFRECESFGTCTLSDEVMITPYNPESPVALKRAAKTFTINISLLDIISAQLDKYEAP